MQLRFRSGIAARLRRDRQHVRRACHRRRASASILRQTVAVEVVGNDAIRLFQRALSARPDRHRRALLEAASTDNCCRVAHRQVAAQLRPVWTVDAAAAGNRVLRGAHRDRRRARSPARIVAGTRSGTAGTYFRRPSPSVQLRPVAATSASAIAPRWRCPARTSQYTCAPARLERQRLRRLASVARWPRQSSGRPRTSSGRCDVAAR